VSPAVQEDIAETPALSEKETKPRGTHTGPMSNEVWIQWMNNEIAEPRFELRLSTESCDTVYAVQRAEYECRHSAESL